MNFKENSWHARMYRAAYFRDLPKDGCLYIKKVTLAVLLFPISWLGYTSLGKYWELSEKIGLTLLAKMVWLLLGLSFGTALIEAGVSQGVSLAIGLTVGPVAAVTVFWLAVQGLLKFIQACENWSYLYDKKKRDSRDYSKSEKPKEDNFFVAFYKAQKLKYCPQINWINEEEEKAKEEPLPKEAG